jgi:hypothetical protein
MIMKRKVAYLLVLLLLVSVLPTCHAAPRPLPHSMKGYELYSWLLDSGWHFTLITGTNRNKTLEEIVSGDNIEREDGWVDIHALGVEGIKSVLNRVPEGEFVSWNVGQFVLPTNQSVVKLVLPPEDIVNEIKDFAKQRGLDFMVWGSW